MFDAAFYRLEAVTIGRFNKAITVLSGKQTHTSVTTAPNVLIHSWKKSPKNLLFICLSHTRLRSRFGRDLQRTIIDIDHINHFVFLPLSVLRWPLHSQTCRWMQIHAQDAGKQEQWRRATSSRLCRCAAWSDLSGSWLRPRLSCGENQPTF